MRSRAAATRPTAHAAASHLEPTSIARSDHCRAPWTSPVSIRSYVRTTASHACAGVSSLTLEQAFRPGEPAAHRCHQRGIQEQVHRDANRCPGRRDRVAGLDGQRVRALPRLDGHVEMAGRVRDLPEQRQIARTRQAVRVGLHEDLVGLVPISARCRLSAHAGRSSHAAVTADGYRRIELAHAYGLRTTNPSQEESWTVRTSTA